MAREPTKIEITFEVREAEEEHEGQVAYRKVPTLEPTEEFIDLLKGHFDYRDTRLKSLEGGSVEVTMEFTRHVGGSREEENVLRPF